MLCRKASSDRPSPTSTSPEYFLKKKKKQTCAAHKPLKARSRTKRKRKGVMGNLPDP